MKKSIILFLGIVALLHGTTWKTEEVCSGHYPVLTLTSKGLPVILFFDGYYPSHLKVAIKKEDGTWDIKEVDQPPGDLLPFYSVARDSHDNIYVVYSYDKGTDEFRIFLAVDSTGNFETRQISPDTVLYQGAPLIRFRKDDFYLIDYLEFVGPEEIDFEIFAGVLNSEGILTGEQATDNLLVEEEYLGQDFLIDFNKSPWIFYTGEDSSLWYTTAVSYSSDWNQQKLNDIKSEFPSAVEYNERLFIAYDEAGLNIHCISNYEGDWEDEVVSQNKGLNSHPCIAHGIGSIHLVWLTGEGDGFLYSQKIIMIPGKSSSETDWSDEETIDLPHHNIKVGYDHYFTLDEANYGHLTYESEGKICYAISETPLELGVKEDIPNEDDFYIVNSTVYFNLSAPADIELSIYNISGQKITTVGSGFYSEGSHSIRIDKNELSSGVYFIHYFNKTLNREKVLKFIVST